MVERISLENNEWGGSESELMELAVAELALAADGVFRWAEDNGKAGNLWNAIMTEDHMAHIIAHAEKEQAGDKSEPHRTHIPARAAMYLIQQIWLSGRVEVTPMEELVADEYSPRNDAIPY